MRKFRRIKGQVYDRIRELAGGDWSPAEIVRELVDGAAKTDAQWSRNDVPTLPTVRAIVKELQPPPPAGSEPWTFGDYPGDDAKLIAQTWVRVVEGSHGRFDRRFTCDEANWVLRLRRAAPSIDPWEIWLDVRDYMGRQDSGDTADLDARLALCEEPDGARRLGRLFGWLWPDRLPRASVWRDAKTHAAFFEGCRETATDPRTIQEIEWQMDASARLLALRDRAALSRSGTRPG